MSYPSYPEYIGVAVSWLGEIPAHWKVISLRRAVKKINNGLTTTQVDEGAETIPVTRIETISHGFIDFGKVGHVPSEEADGRFLLQHGDILLSHINSLPMVGNVAINLSDRNLLHGMNLLRVQCDRKECTPLYLYYWLKSKNLRQEIESRAKPAINQASLPVDEIKKLPCLAPPLKEQTQIARFLDHQTARIDALIVEQQRLIELLKEKRQAVISHAVTKGLDPDVAMKDSGIDGLNEVPHHWVVSRFKRGIYFLTDYEANGSFSDTKDKVTLDTGEPYAWFVRATDLENNRIGMVDGNRFCDESSYNFLNKTKLKGEELLVAKRGEIGKVYALPPIDCRATLAPNLYAIRLNESLDSRFSYYWLSSSFGRPQLELANKSTTIGALYKDDVKSLVFCFPPITEQEAIAAFLDNRCALIDGLIGEAGTVVEILKERRSALVSAAVTGKIDVRDWEPPASETFPQSTTSEEAPA